MRSFLVFFLLGAASAGAEELSWNELSVGSLYRLSQDISLPDNLVMEKGHLFELKLKKTYPGGRGVVRFFQLETGKCLYPDFHSGMVHVAPGGDFDREFSLLQKKDCVWKIWVENPSYKKPSVFLSH